METSMPAFIAIYCSLFCYIAMLAISSATSASTGATAQL